ncbi:hypothetical protein [Longitalea luteola]|uniref:hypothetical protein n=1 Tax=Longitalea luteola TaxID=2812563 RepID=UPI001A968704|nr:hypothetical protein [Longitalea luteola]
MRGTSTEPQDHRSHSNIIERIKAAFRKGNNVCVIELPDVELIVISKNGDDNRNNNDQAHELKSLAEVFGHVTYYNNSVTQNTYNTNSNNTNSFNNAASSFNTNTNTGSGKQDVSTEIEVKPSGAISPDSSQAPVTKMKGTGIVSQLILPILLILFAVGCFIPQNIEPEWGKNLIFLLLVGLGGYVCLLVQKAFGSKALLTIVVILVILLSVGFGIAKPNTVMGTIYKAVKDLLIK